MQFDPHVVPEQECSLKALKAALRNGSSQEDFPIGTAIPDTWDCLQYGKIDMPWLVAHYALIMTDDGNVCNGVYLIRKNALPFHSYFSRESAYYESANLKNFLTTNVMGAYVHGCSRELLDVIGTIRLKTSFYASKRTMHELDCQFFLPSMTQLGLAEGYDNRTAAEVALDETKEIYRHGRIPEKFAHEGNCWSLYEAGRKPIFKDFNGRACQCWLRTQFKGMSRWVWSVLPDGRAERVKVTRNNLAIAPACVILAR